MTRTKEMMTFRFSLLLFLTSLLALGFCARPVEGEEQTAISKAQDGSLHIVNENDVHINTTANGRVFLNGIDVVEQQLQQQRNIEQLMDRLNGSTTGEAMTTNTTSTTASCQRRHVLTSIQLANPHVTVRFDGDDIDMYSQGIAEFSFGTAKCRIGNINLGSNTLTSVGFGQITSVGGEIHLYNNDLTSVDFGQITSVGSDIFLYDNDLTSVDFGQITSVDGIIYLHDNDRLTSVDCTGVAIDGCICVDAGVTLTNCPAKCTGSICNN